MSVIKTLKFKAALYASFARYACYALHAITAALLVACLVITNKDQAFAFGFGSSSNSSVNENPLTAVAKFQPSAIGVGGTADLVVEMQIASPYRAYLDAFKISIDEPQGFKLDDLRVSPIITFHDTISKSVKEGVEKAATLRTLVEIPEDLRLGDQIAKIKLVYQACTDDHCLFPKTIILDAPLRAVSAEEATALLSTAAAAPTRTQSPSAFQKALSEGLLPAIALMFFAGFLTSLTPCIYPMIPITLAVLGARTKGQSHWRSFSLSLVYVLGIALTYSALGVVAASTGALFGSVLGNVWVVTGIALIFLAMALSMFGFYEIQAPEFVRQRLGIAASSSGYSGAFMTGLFAGIVASPCVGPVLVGALTHIAQTQDKWLGFAMLFSFAMGLGVLFIALGLSSSTLHRLPKAGPWMESVKFIFGAVMIAMALYYVKPVYPDWLFQILLGAALVAIASLFGAFETNSRLTPFGRLRKGAMIATLIVGSVFVATGVITRAGVRVAGANAILDSESYPKLNWLPYSDEAYKSAIKSGKPLIIDFYADWCVACIELEKYTFTDSRIQELSKEFVLLKIDATNDFTGLDALKKRYQVVGLPTMIFYDVKGTLRPELTLTGFEKADAFLNRMTSTR